MGDAEGFARYFANLHDQEERAEREEVEEDVELQLNRICTPSTRILRPLDAPPPPPPLGPPSAQSGLAPSTPSSYSPSLPSVFSPALAASRSPFLHPSAPGPAPPARASSPAPAPRNPTLSPIGSTESPCSSSRSSPVPVPVPPPAPTAPPCSVSTAQEKDQALLFDPASSLEVLRPAPPAPPLPPRPLSRALGAHHTCGRHVCGKSASLNTLHCAKNGSLAWLLQEAVDDRLKRQKLRQSIEERRQLGRTEQYFGNRPLENMDTSIHQALDQQCQVVKTLRKSLADEFERLRSSSNSNSDDSQPTRFSTTADIHIPKKPIGIY